MVKENTTSLIDRFRFATGLEKFDNARQIEVNDPTNENFFSVNKKIQSFIK